MPELTCAGIGETVHQTIDALGRAGEGVSSERHPADAPCSGDVFPDLA